MADRRNGVVQWIRRLVVEEPAAHDLADLALVIGDQVLGHTPHDLGDPVLPLNIPVGHLHLAAWLLDSIGIPVADPPDVPPGAAAGPGRWAVTRGGLAQRCRDLFLQPRIDSRADAAGVGRGRRQHALPTAMAYIHNGAVCRRVRQHGRAPAAIVSAALPVDFTNPSAFSIRHRASPCDGCLLPRLLDLNGKGMKPYCNGAVTKTRRRM